MIRTIAMIVICLPFFVHAIENREAQGTDITDLYYLPSEGRFAGRTSFNSINEELKIDVSGSDVTTTTINNIGSQLLSYGVSNWFILSVEIPYLLGGDTKTSSGGIASTTSIDSEFLGAAFNFSFLFSDNQQTGVRSGIDIYYNPKFLNDIELGYFGLAYRTRGSFSEQASWLLTTAFTQYQKSESLESYYSLVTSAYFQFKLSDSFFIRPGALFTFRGDNEYIELDLEVLYAPRFTADFSIGGRLGNDQISWLLSAQYTTGNIDYYTSTTSGDGKNEQLILGGHLQYEF